VWPIGADSRRGRAEEADGGWSDDQMQSVADQDLQALSDVCLRFFVGNTRDRFLRFFEARFVLARHGSEKTRSRRPQVFEQQAARPPALRAGVGAAEIHNQFVDTIQTPGIRHY